MLYVEGNCNWEARDYPCGRGGNCKNRQAASRPSVDAVVSVGRGTSKDVEGGLKLVDVLGDIVGSSRTCVGSGWITIDHQVG